MFDWLTPDTLELLGRGLALTLALTVVTSAFASALAIPVGLLRLSPQHPLHLLGTGYVEIFRSLPALVLVIGLGFALPNGFAPDMRRVLFFDNSFLTSIGNITGLSVPYYAIAAVLGLSLNTSAYLAELLRAGVGTLRREHFDAARSLGATPAQVLLNLLLPQGIAAAYPAITTRLIHNMKNTALASFLAVPEFFKAIQASISLSFRAVELLLVAVAGFLLIAGLMSLLLGTGEVWLKRRRPHRWSARRLSFSGPFSRRC